MCAWRIKGPWGRGALAVAALPAAALASALVGYFFFFRSKKKGRPTTDVSSSTSREEQEAEAPAMRWQRQESSGRRAEGEESGAEDTDDSLEAEISSAALDKEHTRQVSGDSAMQSAGVSRSCSATTVRGSSVPLGCRNSSTVPQAEGTRTSPADSGVHMLSSPLVTSSSETSQGSVPGAGGVLGGAAPLVAGVEVQVEDEPKLAAAIDLDKPLIEDTANATTVYECYIPQMYCGLFRHNGIIHGMEFSWRRG